MRQVNKVAVLEESMIAYSNEFQHEVFNKAAVILLVVVPAADAAFSQARFPLPRGNTKTK